MKTDDPADGFLVVDGMHRVSAVQKLLELEELSPDDGQEKVLQKTVNKGSCKKKLNFPTTTIR